MLTQVQSLAKGDSTRFISAHRPRLRFSFGGGRRSETPALFQPNRPQPGEQVSEPTIGRRLGIVIRRFEFVEAESGRDKVESDLGGREIHADGVGACRGHNRLYDS